MIRNKSKQFCSLINKSMFNLEEFQFSKVNKTVSTSISNQTTRISAARVIEQSTEEKQYDTINIPIEKNKNKAKISIPDPCKTYEKMHEWRKTHIAPVDTMGCDRLTQQHQSQQVKKYQTLISLMLSVQTTDQITSMVTKRLQDYGLTPENIAQTAQQKLVQLIYQSNFNKRKAKNIIQVSRLILQIGLPKNKQQLLNLPGVGVKIAMIYQRAAEGVLDGIGVDTHVHRISNRLGWVLTSNPNKTQDQLQNIFPKKYWADINIDLVGFGQMLCNAKKPLCSQCPVRIQCPSSLVKNQKLKW